MVTIIYLATSTSSSETQGLLAGTMRYFRAKVYFKSWRAPGNLFLPNQFQKWSNSVPLIGQKNMSNQRWGLDVELCRLLTRSSFLQRSPTQLLGPYNGKIVVDGFRKKNIQTKPRKRQALTWRLGNNTVPSIFSADLSRFLHCCFWLQGKLVEYPRLLTISPWSLNDFWNLPRYAKCKSPLHGPRNYVDRTCEQSANYSPRTFSCYRFKPKCNFAVCPLYDTDPQC